MSTPQRRARLPHLHNFRGLAILFIIATHCMIIFDWSLSPLVREVLARIVANGTIFFLFIAGYLFDHLSAGYRVIPYWKRKFQFVVVPYVLVSIPALIVFTTVLKREGMAPAFYDQPAWRQVMDFLVTGSHLAPFWFIPTIIVFYLAAPLLYRIFSFSAAYALLPLLLILGALVPRGDHNPLQSFVHFLPVWVLGMACSRFRVPVDSVLVRVFWLLPLVVLALFAAEMVMTRGTHSWYSNLQKSVMALFLLEGFRRLGSKADPWFGLAGTLSFGLFFLHSYVISAGSILVARVLGHKPEGNLFLLVVAACAATIATIAIVQVVKKATGHRSRLLIGV